MKFYFLFTLLISSLLLSQAQASVQVSGGVVTINVSGSDGSGYGDDGSSAGSVNVNLAYTDATKTSVRITGTTSHYGKTSTVDETVALKDLKSIRIYAVGGDGVRGEDGSYGSSGWPGSSGSDGSNGSDGCPPSNGSDGTDGGRGGDGGNGQDGGNGGNGGNGGSIRVSASPDQNELLLYVSLSTSGGSGASGGAGGAGGSGGPGGSGGRGGAGGKSNCVDSEGKPTFGWDGSSGRDGSTGPSGSDGYSGSDGSSGYSGNSGSYRYDLVTPTGTQSFKGRFDLQITQAQFTDDNDNSILEPGERVYLTSLEVTNKGPMPSPEGQTIQFSFGTSSTLISPTTLTAKLVALAPGASQKLVFKKGALPLQVPDQDTLIGKKAVASAQLAINNVRIAYNVDSGMAVRWPVTLNTDTSSTSASFEVPGKTLTYTIKNVGAKYLGQGNPLFVSFNWTSATVPGSDVSIALADGRIFSLAQPVQISDIAVPANSSVALPVKLLFHNSKIAASASGSLNVSIRLPDFNSANQNILQTLSTKFNLNLDVNAIIWNQTVSLANSKIQCVFPNLATPTQAIASFRISKAKDSGQVQVQVEVPGSASSSVSPVITIPAARAFAYLEQFRSGGTAQTALDFLNKMISPNTPKGAWSFKSCTTLAPQPAPLMP